MTTVLFNDCINMSGFFASGSRVICSPPPEDTDEDYVLHTPNKKALQKELEALGYVLSSKDMEKYKAGNTDPFAMYNSFDAYRHPDNKHNLIVVSNQSDFKMWKVATLLARDLNLTDKAERIALFRVIRSRGEVYQSVSDLRAKEIK